MSWDPEPDWPPDETAALRDSVARLEAEAEQRRQAEWDEWLAWTAKRRRRLRRTLVKWGIIGIIWIGVALVLTGLWFLRDLPRPEAALDAVRKPSLVVQDASGADIATFGDVVGEPLRLADLPAYLPEAAIAVEDRRFYQHHGLDYTGIARAMLVDLRDLRVVQGGSTITQQVAKTLFLSNARTWRRKLQELILTRWLEKTFTKQEILEIWLNRVYLGQGAWGVDAAAHVYFGISARNLNLWQSAVIAGLPRAPSRFNPRADAAAARARAKEVLQAMVETNAISQAQADIAAMEIDFTHGTVRQSGWFADWASALAESQIPPNADAVLQTTLDGALQNRVDQHLAALLDGPGGRAHVSQGAVVVLDAQTGAVRAMAGGRDYQQSPYNRAVDARRQPGSAFKPFVWLTALAHGTAPDDQVLDAPIHVGSYAPENFSHSYLGTITVEEALALSINTASVRLLLQSGGARAVAATAAKLGIADKLPDNASLALGTGEVGLLEMTGAYATFCNGGNRITPYGTAALVTNGATLPLARSLPQPVIDAAQAAAMARMLRAVVTRGTGQGAAVPGHDVLGKTGTSQDFRDAWFIGCIDGSRVIGIWLGNDDGTPMRRVEGGSLPAALFREIGE